MIVNIIELESDGADNLISDGEDNLDSGGVDNLLFLMIIPAVLILVLLILLVKYCVQKCKNARQSA